MPAASRLVEWCRFEIPAILLLILGVTASNAQTAPQAAGATCEFCAERPGGRMAHAGPRFCQYPLQPPQSDHPGNVNRLRIAWTFSDGAAYGHEGAPLVVGSPCISSRRFRTSPMHWICQSRARRSNGAFAQTRRPLAIGKACCDAAMRGWAYANGKLIYNLLDDHTVAVDAQTGKEVWRTKMGNVENGETMTMSPFVVGRARYLSATAAASWGNGLARGAGCRTPARTMARL